MLHDSNQTEVVDD